MKRILFFILLLTSFAAGLRAQGVYSINPQPVCWTLGSVDSTILSIIAFNVRDSTGLFKGYVSPVTGSYVDVSAGGTFSAGYCCCNSGTASSVSITDNNDGTYTAIVGTDTTTIYTKADSLFTTQNIAISDTTYLANSVVQDILIAIANEVNNLRSETGCDLTITQASHGFSIGDLLTQNPNTGVYADAAADTSINFPVGYVCEVVDANNFKVDTEGWVSGAHGQTIYRDYFLQDAAGTVDTISGSFPIFAYRTFTSTLRYFDIPEYVADGEAGGGTTIIASNGLNDQDGSSNVDVELGGTLDKNTLINGANFRMTWDTLNDFYVTGLQDEMRVTTDTLANRHAEFVVDVGTSFLEMQNFTLDARSEVNLQQTGQVSIVAQTIDESSGTTLVLDKEYITITGVPNYANDAAADADLNLPSGGLYTVTAEDRSLRIKP